nr:L-histidine N(alpha)-methyltransferase [Robertkochia sp. 3YJGBD-33]
MSTLEEDVFSGLTAYPKKLPSKYIYDKTGDELFQKIMDMPEYYLTRAEFQILKKHKEKLSKVFDAFGGFDLIELGAGDGKKTKILLKHFMEKGLDFHYTPIDISQNVLDSLKASLKEELPGLQVTSRQGMYFKVLQDLAGYNKRRKIIMVLGSNIGNLMHKKAIDFLKNIRDSMGEDDLLFMGFDQKKHPQVILDAYNDNTGITAAFNKNLLVRINRELDADFEPDNFLHWETYNPETGTAKSFLVAKEPMTVQLKKISLEVHFKAWETIHTEISQKYDDDTVRWLAGQSDLVITEIFGTDDEAYKNYIFKRR